MNNTIFYVLAIGLIMTSCSGRKEKEINDPFSGKLYEKYEYIETDEGSFKKDGYFKRWYSNGQIASDGNYEENRKTGEWKVYYKDGNLKEIATYSKDTLYGLRKLYHSNGELSMETVYVNGKKEGPVKEWFENGQIKEEYNSVNGLYNGEYRSFFENGAPKSIGTYKEGLKDGLWEKYSSKNGEETKELFEKGTNITLVGTWKINDSYTIKYYKDGSAIRISENGQESKNTYSLENDNLYWGYNRFKILSLSPKEYKIKDNKMWGESAIFHGIKID